MLRIIAGEFRSRPLAVPRGRDLTRPMGGRTREALFDLLRGWFEGAAVIDLFAGVGTLGLEAASRGAARVTCVERDRFIARLLRENIHALRCEDRVAVVEADALAESTVAALPRPVDIVFCDPPFVMASPEGPRSARGADDDAGPGDEAGVVGGRSSSRIAAREAARLDAMLARLRPLFADRGFLALRLPQPRRGAAGAIAGFTGPEIHGYGDQQWIHLYAPAAGAAASPGAGA